MCEDDERDAWDRAWRAMPYHRLPSPPSIDGVAGRPAHCHGSRISGIRGRSCDRGRLGRRRGDFTGQGGA
jgi:hypothetical protein